MTRKVSENQLLKMRETKRKRIRRKRLIERLHKYMADAFLLLNPEPEINVTMLRIISLDLDRWSVSNYLKITLK